MDTFMDKLAQKFTAGEMIKANSAADAAEVEKLKTQMEEYNQCLQDMRQVHLKNAENVDKLSTLIEECMAKIGEVKGGSVSTQDLEKRLEILLGANFDVKLSESMDSIREYIKQQNVDKEELAQSCYEKIIVDLAQQNAELENSLAQQVLALETKITQFNALMDQKFLNQNEEFSQKLIGQNEDINQKLAQQTEVLEGKLVHQQNTVLESKLAQQQKAILEEVEGVRTHIAGRINEMKNTKQDFSEIQTMIEGSKIADKEAVDAMLREIQEYVHKEDVKVYRNVQAVIVEHSEKNEEQVSGMNRRLTDSVALITKLAGGALAFSAISVILQLLSTFGIL